MSISWFYISVSICIYINMHIQGHTCVSPSCSPYSPMIFGLRSVVKSVVGIQVDWGIGDADWSGEKVKNTPVDMLLYGDSSTNYSLCYWMFSSPKVRIYLVGVLAITWWRKCGKWCFKPLVALRYPIFLTTQMSRQTLNLDSCRFRPRPRFNNSETLTK